MRIAIYSGTFDPIHTGHAIVSQYVSQYGGVDEVWLMPSRLNPLKMGSAPMSEEKRLRLARIVASKCRGVRVSDFELGLPYPSYSYVTLTRLREAYPEHRFVLVVGSDNWQCFRKWRNWEEIIREFGLLVYPRPGYEIDGEEFPENVTYLREAPRVEMSSTFIREAIRAGKDINYFVPPEIANQVISDSE